MARTADVYVGYVMVVKFQVHRKQAWMRKGSFWASFKVFQDLQYSPKPKKPVRITEGAFRIQQGQEPSSLTQDFWGSGDGCCYFRDHCLETTDGQSCLLWPSISGQIHTQDPAHSAQLLPLSQAPLTYFLSCLQIISIDKLQNGDGGVSELSLSI